MRRKALNERELRVLASMKLLSSLEQQHLPAECTSRDDIERLLGLHAANLIKASFDPSVRERSGDLHIPRAVVSEVTPEGLSALTRARREQPEQFAGASPRRPRARRASAAGGHTGEKGGGPV